MERRGETDEGKVRNESAGEGRKGRGEREGRGANRKREKEKKGPAPFMKWLDPPLVARIPKRGGTQWPSAVCAIIKAPKTPSRVGNGEGVSPSQPTRKPGGTSWAPAARSENDFGAFWGRQNGSCCNCKFCIFPANFETKPLPTWMYMPSLSASCLMLSYLYVVRLKRYSRSSGSILRIFGLHNTSLSNSLSFPLSFPTLFLPHLSPPCHFGFSPLEV